MSYKIEGTGKIAGILVTERAPDGLANLLLDFRVFSHNAGELSHSSQLFLTVVKVALPLWGRETIPELQIYLKLN